VTEETAVEGLKKASERALRLGCTSIGDAGIGADAFKAYQTALAKGYLKIRAHLFINEFIQQQSYETGIRTGFGNDMIKVGPSKLLWTSPGACTAALLSHTPMNRQRRASHYASEVLDEKAKTAATGNQSIHAIGDMR
jgi:predicted amidohydrolase YtcJ